MEHAKLQDPIEEEQTIVPGTEGTEYEGMSEDEIERAEFDKVVDEDPDIESASAAEPKVEPEVKPEDELGDKPKAEDKEDDKPKADAKTDAEVLDEDGKPVKEEKEPTGLEWLDDLPEETQAKAKDIIGRQGQAIARLDQRVKSHLGQLQPAQRAIAKLTKELGHLKGKLIEQQPPAIDIEKRKKDYNDWADEEYKEFPEEATKLKKRFSDSLDGIPEVLETATPEVPSTLPAGPDPKEETLHLATAYSDWGERRFSPEFDQWIATQQPEITALLNSPYAADNVALLDAFTTDNPQWVPPQTPDQFHSLAQAQHSPLYRGWAEGEGINPDMNLATVPDHHRDQILTRFKSDLGAVLSENEQADDPKVTKLAERRSKQLQNRDPGSRRLGVTPGTKIDLDTEEGQRAYYKQLIAADPDLK